MSILARVLIIGPIAEDRQVLAQAIFSLGHTVIETSSEKDALLKFKTVRPDLVLLSVGAACPEHFEILDYIKYDVSSHNISVIVISDGADISSIVKSIEMGADDYLTRPVQAPILKAKVNASIEKKLLRDRDENYRNQIELYLEEVKDKNAQVQSLLRVLTHDIANPLTIIQGNISIAHSNFKNKKELSEKYFEKIERATQNIADILQHVRQMQAIESGKLTVKLGPVDIGEAIGDGLFTFKEKLDAKKVSLVVENQLPADRKIMAEKISFSNQVLNNLISNAIKFSAENNIITICAKEVEHNFVQINICDQGIGIPTTLLSNIFMPNKKTSRKGTAGEEGTGFGMPLVKTYIERYGGSIEIKSKTIDEFPDSHGTEVILKLKRAI
ncbi:MAG: hypothetical protein A2504_13630 [Bdellovibrionales bacterium RIFOXYD12_FULL_39_22]|nr:MAG: hypothetical protein A2385_00355 [Bdellovibrionales bacterium RIFOXYB1_FULL_39_21]OFZ43871.1 MAG: hypothetical protein A2485_05175 [Bdellovibrionales bacterium RIFOXYC12_FULL_39_17]OFZ48795.1 MAG: hypothetical protein A2404_17670 [Bdellovibrionales bacterium RIFOXYC1_FULL_39_130]OFZ76528.1 MAG: hypothetical protein A2560_06335 [Bdellovibrionales bacterium RIFOXYD1_FULL_39_84]OFZ94762.1 MAG: hypothetical protein A2504_13630 [Bdellovibrionales bacterium RIFOXYD12_FULL_39_22]